MKILITGGSGYIGKNLSLALLKRGHKVVAVDNFITSSKTDFKNFLKGKKLEFFEGDITDKKIIKKIQKAYKFDEIYHLACPTGVPNIKPRALEMLMACSLGTKNILDLAVAQKSRVLFTSSSEVYGDPKVFPQNENYTGNVNPTGFRGPYEEGKRFSESLVTSYVNKFSLNGKIVRLFNAYGPLLSKNESRVIPRFINQAISSKDLTILGNGKQKRTFCFVSDIVAGLILIMKKGKREVYNLGSDKEISISALAKLIIKLTGSNSSMKLVNTLIPDHNRRKPDLKKVRELGWEYTVELEEGLLKTIKFFKEK